MIHRIRHLPDLGGQMVRSVLELALTAWDCMAGSRLAPLAAIAALSAFFCCRSWASLP